MAQTHVYKCSKCGLIEQYSIPKNNLKCPKCKCTMIKQR